MTYQYPYNPFYFAAWRIALGVYLLFYLLATFPYRTELYSREGLLPDPVTSYLYGYLPNILNRFDSPEVITFVFCILILASLTLIVGFERRLSALVLFLGHFALHGRNPLTEEPSLAFIGLLLLLLTTISEGEPLSLQLRKTAREWYMPRATLFVAWGIAALTFSLSGIDRLMSPMWQSGEALRGLLEIPIARDVFYVDWLRNAPPLFLQLQTWAAIAAFTLSVPLAVFRATRPVIWSLWVYMFVFVLLILTITQVSLGMLLYFALLFDVRWIEYGKEKLLHLRRFRFTVSNRFR